MNDIRVSKAQLIAIMHENRASHHAIVVEAQEGFRAKVIERLDEMLKIARKGKPIDIHVGLVLPEDHTDDYDRVIGLLELSLDDEVELSEYEYTQYVQDIWGWSKSFTTTNSFYSAAARNI